MGNSQDPGLKNILNQQYKKVLHKVFKLISLFPNFSGNHQKTFSFLMISQGMKWKHWEKFNQNSALVLLKVKNLGKRLFVSVLQNFKTIKNSLKIKINIYKKQKEE